MNAFEKKFIKHPKTGETANVEEIREARERNTEDKAELEAHKERSGLRFDKETGKWITEKEARLLATQRAREDKDDLYN